MHRYDRPGDHPAASHLQVLTRRQFNLRSIIQKLFQHSVVILLPAVVREGSYVVENEAIVFCVELSWRLCRSRAPSYAKAVDEFAKRGIVRGFLLCAGANECQQCTDYR